jgi:Domain of unknown function (DUF4158)
LTSIERTAYPRFKRLITAGELHHFFSPSQEETQWAAERTDSDGHLLGLLLALKSYQRMGCFSKREEIPEMVVDFRGCVRLGALTPVSGQRAELGEGRRSCSAFTRGWAWPWELGMGCRGRHGRRR